MINGIKKTDRRGSENQVVILAHNELSLNSISG